MTTEVFIDLGRPDDRVDLDAAEPIRRLGTWHVRAIALAVLAVLMLALPTMSLRPQPLITQLGMFPRPVAGHQNQMLVGDAVIVIAEGAVTAFEFDGTKRWSYHSDEPVDYMFVNDAPAHGAFLLGTMMLRSGAGRTRELAVGRVIALDRHTGTPRWHIDGSAWQAGDLIVGGDQKSLQVYQGNPPTLRWQADGFAYNAIDSAGHRAWTLAADGTLSERDVLTGEVLRSRKLPEIGIPMLFGGRVFVHSESRATTAYDAGTLERVEWPGEWLPSDECGPVFCATKRSDRSSSIGGIDRQSGRVLWTVPEDQFVWPGDVGLLRVRPNSGVGMTPLVGVIDPLTGQTRVSLTGWNVINSSDGILVRMEQGRMHIARLDADGARPLGSVPHLSSSCSSAGDVLMCDLIDGKVGVWRLAP